MKGAEEAADAALAETTTGLGQQQIDLHKFMLERQGLLDVPAGGPGRVGLEPSSSSLAAAAVARRLSCKPATGWDELHWDELYGSHRWRKIFQRLTDKRGRFNGFQRTYAEYLAGAWARSPEGRLLGPVKRVSCVCVRNLISVGKADAETARMSWGPERRTMWEINVGAAAGRNKTD